MVIVVCVCSVLLSFCGCGGWLSVFAIVVVVGFGSYCVPHMFVRILFGSLGWVG